MIRTVTYNGKHQLRTYWNKYAGTEQYSWRECNIYCIYFWGILIYKKVICTKPLEEEHLNK